MVASRFFAKQSILGNEVCIEMDIAVCVWGGGSAIHPSNKITSTHSWLSKS